MNSLLKKLLNGGIVLMLVLTLFNTDIVDYDTDNMLRNPIPPIEDEDDEDIGMHVGSNDLKTEYWI